MSRASLRKSSLGLQRKKCDLPLLSFIVIFRGRMSDGILEIKNAQTL
jgi:hypothetical protein